MTEASTELLPCPFCGSPGKMIHPMGHWISGGFGPNGSSVTCSRDDCSCCGKACYGPDRDAQAIAAWNTRHRIAGQAELREALEQASEWVALMWPQVPLHVRRNMADRYSAHRATVDAALSQSPSLNGEGK